MVRIKLYQTDKLLKAYLNAWNIEKKETFDFLTKKMISDSTSVDKMIKFLEDKIMENITPFIHKLSLPKERVLALAHIIYIEENIFREIDIFSPGKKKEELNELLMNFYPKYALPITSVSQMPAQTIRIYNPFRRLWIFIKKVRHNVFHKN